MVNPSRPTSPKNPAASNVSRSRPGATYATATIAISAATQTPVMNFFVDVECMGEREEPPTPTYVHMMLSPSTNERTARITFARMAKLRHLLWTKSHTQPFARCAPKSAPLLLLVPAQLRSAGVGGFFSPLICDKPACH